MSLLAYNLTTKTVPFQGTAILLPSSGEDGERGPGVNVTSEVRAFTEAQRRRVSRKVGVGDLVLLWTGAPEFELKELAVEEGDPATSLELETLKAPLGRFSHELRCTISALNGEMALSVMAVESKVFANRLNSAPAGTVKVRAIVALQDLEKVAHCWARFPLSLSAGEAVTDVDVGVPTIEPSSVVLKKGFASFDVVLDTDAGATKTYTSGDAVSVTVKTSGTSKVFGVDVADVVLTIDVV